MISSGSLDPWCCGSATSWSHLFAYCPILDSLSFIAEKLLHKLHNGFTRLRKNSSLFWKIPNLSFLHREGLTPAWRLLCPDRRSWCAIWFQSTAQDFTRSHFKDMTVTHILFIHSSMNFPFSGKEEGKVSLCYSKEQPQGNTTFLQAEPQMPSDPVQVTSFRPFLHLAAPARRICSVWKHKSTISHSTHKNSNKHWESMRLSMSVLSTHWADTQTTSTLPLKGQQHQSGGQESTLLLPARGAQWLQALVLQHQLSLSISHFFTLSNFPLVFSVTAWADLNQQLPSPHAACPLLHSSRRLTSLQRLPTKWPFPCWPWPWAPQPHVQGF